MLRLALLAALLCILSAVLCVPAPGSTQETIEALRARADSAAPADCSRICIEAARRLIQEIGKHYSDGNTELARKTTEDAIHYAELGTLASVQTHRHLKDNEISIRKFAHRLAEIERNLSYDDRGPVDVQIVKLEKLRDLLLDAMFGTPKKSLEGKR